MRPRIEHTEGRRVLYITYNGLADHIAQSQILPYVEGLAARGWRMTVVSHEKSLERVAEVEHRLGDQGIAWVPLRYRGGSPATMGRHIADEISAGLARAMRGERPVLVHTRSYLPSAAGVVLARALRAPFVLDMRGFWIDEKIDSGRWKKGALYRFGKSVEAPLFGAADAIVSLTHAGRQVLETWGSVRKNAPVIEVIPTSVDLDRYRAVRPPPGPFTLAYLGSLGERYPLDAMAVAVAEILRLRTDARWRVYTHGDPGLVRSACARRGIPPERVSIETVPHDHIARRLEDVHATISLVKPSTASIASCPTKFGESLAAGRPVLVNEGIGDCADIVRAHGVGATTDLSEESLVRAAAEIVRVAESAAITAQCRSVAEQRFSLSSAVDRYESVYTRALANRARARAAVATR